MKEVCSYFFNDGFQIFFTISKMVVFICSSIVSFGHILGRIYAGVEWIADCVRSELNG